MAYTEIELDEYKNPTHYVTSMVLKFGVDTYIMEMEDVSMSKLLR